MSDLRADLRALITEYGRDGGNDDIDNVLDRAIALIQLKDGITITAEDWGVAPAAVDRWIEQCVPDGDDYLQEVATRLRQAA